MYLLDPIGGLSNSIAPPIQGFQQPDWGGIEDYFRLAWESHTGQAGTALFEHWYPVEHSGASLHGGEEAALQWYNHFVVAITNENNSANPHPQGPSNLVAIQAGMANWQAAIQAATQAAADAAAAMEELRRQQEAERQAREEAAGEIPPDPDTPPDDTIDPPATYDEDDIVIPEPGDETPQQAGMPTIAKVGLIVAAGGAVWLLTKKK